MSRTSMPGWALSSAVFVMILGGCGSMFIATKDGDGFVASSAPRGAPVGHTEIAFSRLSDTALHVAFKVTCTVAVTGHWCPIKLPGCFVPDDAVTNVVERCPASLLPGASIRSPWGIAYPGHITEVSNEEDGTTAGVASYEIPWQEASATTALPQLWRVELGQGQGFSSLELPESVAKVLQARLPAPPPPTIPPAAPATSGEAPASVPPSPDPGTSPGPVCARWISSHEYKAWADRQRGRVAEGLITQAELADIDAQKRRCVRR